MFGATNVVRLDTTGGNLFPKTNMTRLNEVLRRTESLVRELSGFAGAQVGRKTWCLTLVQVPTCSLTEIFFSLRKYEVKFYDGECTISRDGELL